MLQSLSPTFNVPANSSRFFHDFSEATSQIQGVVHLGWNQIDGIVVNQDYDSELIKYDSQYCTSISAMGDKYTIPTLTYIDQILHFLKESPSVIDIGCGQGEFVFALRDRGIGAIGFDPVLSSSSPILHSRFYEPTDITGDL